MRPLEANWVSGRFAAPGEGQEEPKEARSQSTIALEEAGRRETGIR